VLGPVLLTLNNAATVYVPRISKEPVESGNGNALRDVENFPATMRIDPATLTARETHDGTEYLVWYKQSLEDGPAGKYLVDSAGTPVYLVDPGINGVHRHTPDGQRQVAKFDAPKATLMSYIIKGILNHQLPWGLVLLGVMIAVVGYLSWITQDVIYRMYVTTPDGEREVFTTKDEEFAQRVAKLVREAIPAAPTPV